MKLLHGLRGPAFIILCLTISAFDAPEGWIKAGSYPDHYEMGIDKGAGQDGKNAATIRSDRKNPRGFGNLMQNSLPDKYLGKRVRMSGYMKSKDVVSWAGFWFRVDQPRSEEALAFDNMRDRSVKGTTDWTRYEIILDVPSNASNLAYGALLVGRGQIWFDNIAFEVVDSNVPTTDKSKMHLPLKEPGNLDFEK